MNLLRLLFVFVLIIILMLRCVDPINQTLQGRLDLIVIDGTLTNLNEPQVIYLNRSKSDSLTGRFGTSPLTGAAVEIFIDSSKVVTLNETKPGRYQAPNSFSGRVGHSYQLRFTLKNGQRYESTPEVMPAVPTISRLSNTFNPTSLPAQRYDGQVNLNRAANDFFVDWLDPAEQRNYYRWDWKLWEKQEWCHTCQQGFYMINSPINNTLYESCFPDDGRNGYYVHDYVCRTACWEIIHNFEINVFDDQLSDGGLIQKRKVAQIPYYQDRGCLVEIRQSSLTAQAYRFYKLAQDQTQNNGGVADSPPTALLGNVFNVVNNKERLVGYFAASAVAPLRYWLDRKQNTGGSPGLFMGLTGLKPSPEGLNVDPNDGKPKPSVTFRPLPTAVCVESDTRTPNKPEGWQD
ncbi:DUF4249 domain-containing protein [Spirosoma utsteinense]|uniref:DUF4249 domain-containing protein n=1 Tax=Spirosoma utsteinense TaxID=2585773 RepID=A0ABR6WFN4_9BACT|nr:DUF4249 domain-containing protein [Spirosoma utsteinense]MBC3788914.1 hypothetical protein [Spirosoma utsteinense]MBC3794831.1 hypothetical protein [Spirosoma utsteinense]